MVNEKLEHSNEQESGDHASLKNALEEREEVGGPFRGCDESEKAIVVLKDKICEPLWDMVPF